MLNDIKLALRGFAKTRGFTAIAVATLALAIGANSAVFSLINALLVRPLPYQEPSRIALIWEQFKTQGLERIPCSPPEFLDLQKEFQSGTGLAAFNYQTFNIGGGDVPERISGAVVSPSLFPLLGVESIKGRTFARERRGNRSRRCDRDQRATLETALQCRSDARRQNAAPEWPQLYRHRDHAGEI